MIFSRLGYYQPRSFAIICDYLSRVVSKEHYAEGTSFYIGKIEMVASTGTYIDSPFHRYEEGEDLSELALESMAEIDGLVVLVNSAIAEIEESAFSNLDVRDRAVLIPTEWSQHWGTDRYFVEHRHLVESAAEYLKNNGARIVGIESYNIDDVSDSRRPVHTILLAVGILIVEHMCNLNLVPDDGFQFSAVAVNIQAFGTFSVRAYAS